MTRMQAVDAINRLHSEFIAIRRAAAVRGSFTQEDLVRIGEIGVANAEAKLALNGRRQEMSGCG